MTFQSRVLPWLLACFGAEIAADKVERNHRFFEEAAELVQAAGMPASECHQLVDYVFGRPVGDTAQEVGGVMVTLAALCQANGLDMDGAGEAELQRIWTKLETIRAKQAAKPKHSPLPEHAAIDGRAVVPTASSWNFDMSTAPRDGKLLQLLILQGDHNCGFEDSHVTPTMGFNLFDNTGEDRWYFPGWRWTHDCIIEQGHGTPFAWALMLEAPPIDDPRVIAAEHEYGPKTDG